MKGAFFTSHGTRLVERTQLTVGRNDWWVWSQNLCRWKQCLRTQIQISRPKTQTHLRGSRSIKRRSFRNGDRLRKGHWLFDLALVTWRVRHSLQWGPGDRAIALNVDRWPFPVLFFLQGKNSEHVIGDCLSRLSAGQRKVKGTHFGWRYFSEEFYKHFSLFNVIICMVRLLGKDTEGFLWVSWATVRFADCFYFKDKTHNHIVSFVGEVLSQAYEEIWCEVF